MISETDLNIKDKSDQSQPVLSRESRGFFDRMDHWFNQDKKKETVGSFANNGGRQQPLYRQAYRSQCVESRAKNPKKNHFQNKIPKQNSKIKNFQKLKIS
jgi:hypothetical protein